jgi:hypothetical protein
MYPARVSVGEYTYLYTIRGMKSLVYAITNAYNKNDTYVSHFHGGYSLNAQLFLLSDALCFIYDFL